MKISASFLSIKENLKNNIEKLDKTSIDYLHLDIMDGKFVNNKTWDIDEIKPLIKDTKKPLDVHLMVNDVLKYVDEYIKINPEIITFHLEADCNKKEVIKKIKSHNIKVGISIKPNTFVEEIIPYLDLIDLVLVMSVEPGFGGQKFLENSSDKIKKLALLKKNKNYHYLIEVDGGINSETIKLVKLADIVVVGSYITKEKNYQKRINNLNNNK